MGSRVGTTISAVIPTLNEEKNVGWVLERMPADVDEILLVDGRSTDGTVAAARRVRPDLHVVSERAPGKGAAIRAGLLAASCDAVVMLDADGSMSPAEIDRFVDKLDEGYELVKGSRFMPGGGTVDISRLRAAGNFCLVQLANRLYAQRFTELCYGYMAMRRDAVRRLRLTADGFEIETQIVVNAVREGMRVAEVPSFEADRRAGSSHLRTFRDGARVLSELLRGRERPLGRHDSTQVVPGGALGATARLGTSWWLR